MRKIKCPHCGHTIPINTDSASFRPPGYFVSHALRELILSHISANPVPITNTEIFQKVLRIPTEKWDAATSRQISRVMREVGWSQAVSSKDGRSFRYWFKPVESDNVIT